MLLYFRLGGYKSFTTTQELSCTALSGTKLKGSVHQDNFIMKSNFKECKSTFIFGHSSSGKSSIIEALQMILTIIKTGSVPDITNVCNPRTDIVELSIACSIDTRHDYEYTIAIHKDRSIQYEQFHKNNTPLMMYNKAKSKLTIQGKKIKSLTNTSYAPPNTSTVLHHMKNRMNAHVSSFIGAINKIHILSPIPSCAPLELDEKQLCTWLQHSSISLDILHCIDSSIQQIVWVPTLRNGHSVVYKPCFQHIHADTYRTYRELSEESYSFKIIMQWLPMLKKVKDGHTVVIDDLHNYINGRAIIKLLTDYIHGSTSINGQLITTTHDVSLLNLHLLSPDQIQFISGSLPNTILALSDYAYEKGDIQTMFLQGCFGGYHETSRTQANTAAQ